MIEQSLKSWIIAAYDAGDHRNINGVWYNYDCPVCETAGKRPRATLGLNSVEGWFHCFRCGSGGKAAEIVERVQLEVLFDDEAFDRVKAAPKKLPQGFEAAEPGSVAWEYLKGRGLPDTTIREAMLGSAWGHPRYTGRLIVPWWTWGDELGGFAGRAIPGQAVDAPTSKYLYPKGMSRSDVYCGEEFFLETPEPLFVCEGSFDALAVWPNGVALGGSPSPDMVCDIDYRTRWAEKTIARPIIMAFDQDAARKTKTFAAAFKRVFPDVQIWTVCLPKGFYDLGELAGETEKIQEVIKKSMGPRFRA